MELTQAEQTTISNVEFVQRVSCAPSHFSLTTDSTFTPEQLQSTCLLLRVEGCSVVAHVSSRHHYEPVNIAAIDPNCSVLLLHPTRGMSVFHDVGTLIAHAETDWQYTAWF